MTHMNGNLQYHTDKSTLKALKLYARIDQLIIIHIQIVNQQQQNQHKNPSHTAKNS